MCEAKCAQVLCMPSKQYVCAFLCVWKCVDILYCGGVCLQCIEASRPKAPPWSLTSVNTDSMERQRWPWVNTKANNRRQAAHACAYTSTKNTHTYTLLASQ